MAYDENLAERIRGVLGKSKGVTEKKMFGGVAFLVDGKMFVGVQKDELMARVGPDNHHKAVSQKHVRPMDFTGKPMVGFIYVAPAGLKGKPALAKWVKMAKEFVEAIPRKKKK